MSLIFLLDYVPILSKRNKTAIVLYYYLDKLKDDSGNVKATYKEIKDHLSLSQNIIWRSFAVLKSLELIETVNDGAKRNQYKVLPIKSIFDSTAEKAKTYAEQELEFKVDDLKQSPLRHDYVDTIPSEFLHTIFDQENMQKAYKDLGRDIRIVKQVAKYFDLDMNRLKAHMDIESFRKKFLDHIKQATQTPIAATIVQPSSSVKTKRTVKTASQAADQHEKEYEGLMKAHLDRKDGTLKPISSWKSAEMLRYFCVEFEKNVGSRYIFQDSGIYKGRDIRHVKTILSKLGNDPQRAINYIDWAFRCKANQVDVISLGLLQSARMLNEFSKYKAQSNGAVSTNGVDATFVKWVEENLSSTFQAGEQYKTHRGLQRLAHVYDNQGSDYDPDISKCIEEARKRKIIT